MAWKNINQPSRIYKLLRGSKTLQVISYLEKKVQDLDVEVKTPQEKVNKK